MVRPASTTEVEGVLWVGEVGQAIRRRLRLGGGEIGAWRVDGGVVRRYPGRSRSSGSSDESSVESMNRGWGEEWHCSGYGEP